MSFGAPAGSTAGLTLENLLTKAHELKASDLFIKAGSPPGFKRLGRIEPSDLPPLTVHPDITSPATVDDKIIDAPTGFRKKPKN